MYLNSGYVLMCEYPIHMHVGARLFMHSCMGCMYACTVNNVGHEKIAVVQCCISICMCMEVLQTDLYR